MNIHEDMYAYEWFQEACEKVNELQEILKELEYFSTKLNNGSITSGCPFCIAFVSQVHEDDCRLKKALEPYP